MSEDLIEVAIKETNNLSIEQLQEMIGRLSTTEDNESLKNEMSKLKIALKQNPAVVSFLLPEDIGQMTQALYKLTNRGILDQLNPETKKREKKVAVTQEDIDNITMDDLL